MTRQLSLDLPPGGAAMGEGDFFVSAANAQAHAMLTQAAPWPQGKLALVGPAGSGKTHLARIWAARSGAVILPAVAVAALTRPGPGAAIAIEDAQTLPRAAEEALFHLHNHLAATGGRLLLTADRPPVRWDIALPDLASRMQATTVVRLGDPDDALLFAVLAKLFADRQLAPEPGVVPWLVARIERSHAAATAAVEALDRAALDSGRAITRALARQVLDKPAAGST